MMDEKLITIHITVKLCIYVEPEIDMTDIFDVDVEKLQSLLLNESAQTSNQKNNMQQEMQFNMLKKYTVLCKHANIDFMSDFSAPLIILLCSKTFDKADECKRLFQWLKTDDALISQFNLRYSCSEEFTQNLESVMTFDNSCLEEWDETQLACFNTVSDWIYFFEYVQFDEGFDMRMEQNEIIARMRHAFEQHDLGNFFVLTPEFLALCVLHVSVNQLPSVKLMERFLSRKHSCFIRDIELRVLRTISSFSDCSSDSKAEAMSFLLIVREISMSEQFFTNLNELLVRQAGNMMMNAAIEENVPKRLQLRFLKLKNNTEKEDTSHLFSTWANNLQLSVLSSKHLQTILYFIKCQPKPIDVSLLKPHFSANILQKFEAAPIIVEIDVDAIFSLLSGLRIYLNNIPTLVDFRVKCLKGLSQSQRKSLSLLNIFQLYVCVFQHESVRFELWKKICPIMNHTTQLCVQNFVKEHDCDYVNVLKNLTYSHACVPEHETDISIKVEK